jgi:hypothetical protein
MKPIGLKSTASLWIAAGILAASAANIAALDRVELSNGNKIHCRIVGESADSVVVKVGKTDTLISRSDIQILTYSEDDFKTELRVASSGPRSMVSRGKSALKPDEMLELRPEDVLEAGGERQMALLFKNGMQVGISPGAAAVVATARTEKKPYASYVEIRVERGEAYCMVQKGQVGHGNVTLHTPNATVRVREALFMMHFDSVRQETSVAVRGGAVGVQLLGSDIGEVIVNGGERVVVSSAKNKVMQDELSSSEAESLLGAESFFARRRVGDVKAPKVRKGRPLVARWYFWTPIVVAGGGGVAALLLLSQEKTEWPAEESQETTIHIEGTYQ